MSYSNAVSVHSPFRDELVALINIHSRENESNTPDYILAKFLEDCLDAFDFATKLRDKHQGRIP